MRKIVESTQATQKHVVVSTPFYASEKVLRALITASNAS